MGSEQRYPIRWAAIASGSDRFTQQFDAKVSDGVRWGWRYIAKPDSVASLLYHRADVLRIGEDEAARGAIADRAWDVSTSRAWVIDALPD